MRSHSTGIEEAAAIAKEAAGGRNVGVLGASVSRQCLEAGLLGEILVPVGPVLLGDAFACSIVSVAKR